MTEPATHRSFRKPPPFPKRLTLELSSRCNLECVMCPRQFISEETGFMDVGLFEKIVTEISRQPVEAVVPFFRGEAMLHPRYVEMMTSLKARTSAKIQMATNAALMTEGVATALLDMGLDFISFSLDAVTRKTYQAMRNGGDFNRVMTNVEAFLRLREIRQSAVPVVQVSFTETRFNSKEKDRFISRWRDRVDRIRIYPQHSEGGRYGKVSDPTFLMDRATRKPCCKPTTDMVVYHDGRVALCNHDWHRKVSEPLGDLRHETIAAAWNGSHYQIIRQAHAQGRWAEIKPCSTCDHWTGEAASGPAVGEVYEN